MQHKVVAGEATDASCRLCRDDKEDPDHLWASCEGTKHLVVNRSVNPNPFVWGVGQLVCFLDKLHEMLPPTEDEGVEVGWD